VSDNNTETTTTTTETPKNDPRKVTVDAVLDMCRELGCEVVELKSFHKVTALNYNKKSLYVGKAKKQMTRLDVSGFEPEEHEAITSMTEEEAKSLKLGAVRAQILPKEIRDEDCDVLEAVRTCIRGLLAEEEGFKLGARGQKDEVAETTDGETEQPEEETEEVEATETEEEQSEEETEEVEAPGPCGTAVEASDEELDGDNSLYDLDDDEQDYATA